ncbi:PhzF family phenazine biosynthesis protein [Haliea sp. E1-2-M8]|uniref:PhzF family phenazine biosynthesis protein n=1 Tax=Haliea sp. E1-2-M8 TaxID=3064706 RepID=UPI00272435D9|nr:PhzF family phenazine biosynthesis protein [Haliea sp. E1-2-M8]MDO8863589.1 PhzF family phenazine biosynthesis protein [Haliea sp. E1-2-M8]
MKLQQYQVDAFASRVFEGNPAAVCPLESWLDDALLQAIATENNLSETAYLVPAGDGFELRWFTPATEVDLCGHATLAAAHVLYTELGYCADSVSFGTRSGELSVRREGELYVLDFPAIVAQPCTLPAGLVEALGRQPAEVLAADDLVAVFASEAEVLALEPDQALLARLDYRGVIVTAPGDKHDFVSRFFAPRVGVPEDPVTGSAHCKLAPYWAQRLGKNRMSARQVSRRGGDLEVELRGDRVLMAGRAVLFMVADIHGL